MELTAKAVLSGQRQFMYVTERGIPMISKIGGLVYGIDNPVSKDEPTIIISRILFSDLSGLKAAEWYELPNKLVHDVTEPNLESRSASSSARLSILRKGQRVIVYHHGSDAGGAYEVNWIIDLTAMKTTRIVVSHAGPEDEMKGIWLPLQKIPQPNIK